MAYQWTPEDKRLFDSDVAAQASSSLKLKGYQADNSAHQNKEVSIEIDCNSKTALATLKLQGELVEYICSLDIGVLAKSGPSVLEASQETSKGETLNNKIGATYEIGYEIQGFHTLLFAQHLVLIKLEPDQERLFQFNLQKDGTEDTDNLNFDVQMAFGTAKLFVSKTERNPCNATDQTAVHTQLVENNQFGIIKFGKGGISTPVLKGTYFVCVKSVGEYSHLSLIANDANVAGNIFEFDDKLMKIPPNHNILGEIPEFADSLEFGFYLNHDPREEEVITIRVTPLKGTSLYRLIVSNTGVEPRPVQKYWNQIGNSLTVSSKDANYQSKGQYRVKIMPAFHSSAVSGVSKFLVSYSVGNTDTLLKEGLPFVGELNDQVNQTFLRIEIPRNSENLTILRTKIQGETIVSGIFNDTGNEIKDKQPDFYIYYMSSGYFYENETLAKACPDLKTKVCHLYLKIERTQKSNCSFIMAYTINNRPLTLHRDHGYDLPQALHPNYMMNFIYYMPQNMKDTMMVEWDSAYSTSRCFIKYTKESQQYAFPTENNFNEMIEGETAMTELTSKQYQDNSVLLITLQLQRNDPLLTQYIEGLFHVYNFALKGRLSVTSSEKKLMPDEPHRGKLKANSWEYFTLNHRSSNNVVIDFESTMSFCKLYVDKGLHTKINKEYQLASSDSLTEKGIVISKSMLPLFESITGVYTVAVRCYSDASYRIEYRSGDTRIHQVRLNDAINLNLLSDAQDYVEFFNYGPLADIQIYFRSSFANVSVAVIQIDTKEIFKDHKQALEIKPLIMPTIEKYDYAVEVVTGGIGKLTIPQTASKNCQFCRFIALVTVSEDDTVEFVVRKSSPSWPIMLEAGIEQFSLLNANESEYYYVRTTNLKEFVQATLLLKSGQISVDSRSSLFNGSSDMSMTRNTLNKYKSHLTINHMPESNYSPAKMYLNVTAKDRSIYTVSHAENQFKQFMMPMTTYKGFLAGGFTRTYTLLTNINEQVQINMKVTSLNDYSNEELSILFERKILSKNLMKIYAADSALSAMTGNYSEVPAVIFYEQLENTFQIQLSSPMPVVVIEIINSHAGILHFTIEATKSIRKDTKSDMVSVNFLTSIIPFQIFDIEVDHERAFVNFQINECTEHIHVEYLFIPNKRSIGTKNDVGNVLYSKYMSQKTVEVKDGPGILRVVVQVSPESYDDTLLLGSMYSEDRKSKVPIPAVYNFWYHVTAISPNDLGIITDYGVSAVDESGNIEVQNLNGQVLIKKIHFENIDKLLSEHDVRVSYSLMLSTDKGILKHLTGCGEFAIEEAKRFYKTDDFHIFTVHDYLNERKLYEEKKFKKDYFDTNATKFVTISPDFFSLGEVYNAVVVAKVLVYRKDVSVSLM